MSCQTIFAEHKAEYFLPSYQCIALRDLIHLDDDNGVPNIRYDRQSQGLTYSNALTATHISLFAPIDIYLLLRVDYCRNPEVRPIQHV